MTWEVQQGDCLDLLRAVPDHSIDAIVTDPPSGTSFMGRKWDSSRGGKRAWIAWLQDRAKEALRASKPGAFALVWAFPRTSHWTADAWEDAGWNVVDVFTHHYSTGAPKNKQKIKPASEHWIALQAPRRETIAKTIERYGTGGLNIDDARIPRLADDVPGWHTSGADGSKGYMGTDTFRTRQMTPEEIQARCGGKGRWPANAIFSHAEGCEIVGTRKVVSAAQVKQGGRRGLDVGANGRPRDGSFEGYGDRDGQEEVPVWECVLGCPVRELDEQSGTVASRFFYCPKPSLAEKEAGCEGLPLRVLNRVNGGGLENDPKWQPVMRHNHHVTIKPVKLCAWLIRLAAPKGGVVLDMFTGSGSVGVAAIQEGRSFLGMEDDPAFAEIARARIVHAVANVQPSLF